MPVPIPIVTNDSKSYLTRKANIARTSKWKLREKRERSALYELNELRASSSLIASVLSTLITLWYSSVRTRIKLWSPSPSIISRGSCLRSSS